MAENASITTDSSKITRRGGGGGNCLDVFQLKAQSTHKMEKQKRRKRKRATEEA